jgi:Tol biopolymer transport system component
MRLLTSLAFALAAVAGLPAAGATNAPAGRIAFSMGTQMHADIYAVSAGGSGLVRLTDDPAADFDPSWSPDGRRITYRHEDRGRARST